MDMNLFLAGGGVLLTTAIIFLILKILQLKTPPCEYRTIEFRVQDSKVTQKPAVFAVPEELDKVQECALVLFSNQVGTDIKIEFIPGPDGDSPFKDVTSFELEPDDSEDQFSKGFPVAVELESEKVEKVFKYKIISEPPPAVEQSPRIRVGPRQTIEKTDN